MSSIGNINNSAGIGYTEMTGLGLTATVQNQVKLEAAASDSMAEDILAALARFRAEGNLNPTSAEMEARLSVVGVAANQRAINQAQDLLFGLQQTYQFALQDAGGNENRAVHTFCNLVEAANGTVSSTLSAESGARSVIAGMTLSGVFGSSVANYPDGPYALLSSLIPDTFNTNTSLQLPAGFWGHGALSPAAMKTMITALETKIASMNSAAPSHSANAVGGDSLTAHQWLAREIGVQSPHDSYSLKQWGEIAEKLQTNAAMKRSQLSIGNGGGIQQVNGQYFVNGQQMSLSQVNFCVRANQYQLIDQQIADQLDAVQRNNEKARQAQAVLAAFKAYDNETIGLDQSATTSFPTMMDSGGGGWGVVQHYLRASFGVTDRTTPSYADYSAVMQNSASAASLTPANRALMTTNINQFFSLFKAADPTFYSDHVTDTNGGPPYAFRGTISNTEFGSLKNNFSNYLSSNSTDNQVAQQRLEALNNTRESILAGMSAFTQGQSQVTDRIGGNL